MTWIGQGREEILVANVDGLLVAMDNVCSHSGGSLADGSLVGRVVTCPLHSWQYDVTTGCCLHIADECLRTFVVEVVDGQVCVELPSPG